MVVKGATAISGAVIRDINAEWGSGPRKENWWAASPASIEYSVPPTQEIHASLAAFPDIWIEALKGAPKGTGNWTQVMTDELVGVLAMGVARTRNISS